jgi:hypothetical protein
MINSPYNRSLFSPTHHHMIHSPIVSHNSNLLHVAQQNSSLQQFFHHEQPQTQQHEFLFSNSPSHQYQSPPLHQNHSFNVHLTPRPPNHQQYQLHQQRKSFYVRQPQMNFSPVKFTSLNPHHLLQSHQQTSTSSPPQHHQTDHQTQNMMYNYFSPNYSLGNETKQQALFGTSYEQQQSPQIQKVYYQVQAPQVTAALWPTTNTNVSPPVYSNGNGFIQN